MGQKTIIQFVCDRCGTEIHDKTGTRATPPVKGISIVPSQNRFYIANNQLTKADPALDLCETCLSSLQIWYTEEFQKIEENWNVVEDTPVMDKTIELLAADYIDVRAGNITAESLIIRYTDRAKNVLEENTNE